MNYSAIETFRVLRLQVEDCQNPFRSQHLCHHPPTALPPLPEANLTVFNPLGHRLMDEILISLLIVINAKPIDDTILLMRKKKKDSFQYFATYTRVEPQNPVILHAAIRRRKPATLVPHYCSARSNPLPSCFVYHPRVTIGWETCRRIWVVCITLNWVFRRDSNILPTN